MGLRLSAHPPAQLGVTDQRRDPCPHRPEVVRRDDEPRHAVHHQLRQARRPGHDDRLSRRHAFQRHQSQQFRLVARRGRARQRRLEHDAGSGHLRRHLGIGGVGDEGHVLAHRRRKKLLEIGRRIGSPHHPERKVRRQRVDHLPDPLVRKQPTDEERVPTRSARRIDLGPSTAEQDRRRLLPIREERARVA